MKTIEELVRIVNIGGGVILDAESQSVDHLVRLAEASTHNNALIILKNASGKSADELARIGAAGRGQVIFDLL